MNYFSRIGLTTLLALSSPVIAEVRATDWPRQQAETAAELDALLPAVIDETFKGELQVLQ
jgi:hypothetical protein